MYAAASAPDRARLFAIAESQDGYFTMTQALAAGFARSSHSYHVKAGNWIREQRGIYRLRQFPATETGHLVPCSLWTRDRCGEPQGGVFPHHGAGFAGSFGRQSLEAAHDRATGVPPQ